MENLSLDLNLEPCGGSSTSQNAVEVEQELCPTVGMSFLTGAEFAKYCFDYAKQVGFALFKRNVKLQDRFRQEGVVRKGVIEKEPQFHMMEELRLKCTKGGEKKSEGSTVTNCPCFIYGRLVGGEFVIRTCNLTHNHPMDPSYSRHLPNYKVIDETTFKKLVNNDDAGTSIKKNFNSFVVASKGRHNLMYDEKDFRNALSVHRRASRIQGDAVAMEEYFEMMTKDNPGFFYRILKDENNRLVNVFWADARVREAFKVFGDIITFDTTFLCNRYEMPFAPFVGVNHHGSSFLLGCALITLEDTDSFVWVFQQWLECMGSAPKGILTDQDKAIGKAVAIVFPDVPHGLCIWHIQQNASRNLGSHSRWPEIQEAMTRVLHDAVTPQEFDDAWADMIEKYQVGNNTWLQDAYNIRGRWAPRYWKSSFWAGMSSTQRSEGMNRFMKIFVSSNTCLRKFVMQYKMALVGKVEEENKNNYKSMYHPLPLDDTIAIACVFNKTYINAKFMEVKQDIDGLRYTNAEKSQDDGTIIVYKVAEKIPKPFWKATKKLYTVTLIKEENDFCCSCKLFEFRGIICRPIIRVLEVEEIDFVPEKYILSRWRKDVYRGYEGVKVEYTRPGQSERVKNAKEVADRTGYLSTLALSTEESLSLFKEETDKLRDALEALLGIKRTGMCTQWFDPTDAAVYGVRRIRPRHFNQRHIQRSAKHVEGATKDPVEKTGNGRRYSTRAKHPSERGVGGNKAQRNRTKMQENQASRQPNSKVPDLVENHGASSNSNKRPRMNHNQIPRPTSNLNAHSSSLHIHSRATNDFSSYIGNQDTTSQPSPSRSFHSAMIGYAMYHGNFIYPGEQ